MRKSWRLLAVSSVAALVGVVALPSASYASYPGTTYQLTYTSTAYGGFAPKWKWANSVGDQHAGDCTLSGYSQVKLAAPDAGYALMSWNGPTYTSDSTDTADIWHADFEFTTVYGTVIARSPVVDSPTMRTYNYWYSFTKYATIRMDSFPLRRHWTRKLER